ncbi:MAG: alcohol dehydrogenase catalytic domain-containing protein, partial [Microthrixaceae bacterium]|nr:alcohol dehydrogenase catalytic domain-containing protein [Microthrixaceae bacterium]
MRAIVLESHGGPEVLTPMEIPDPVPGPEEVLVDIAATAVNRADLLQRMGLYPGPPAQHEVPGLELAGTVSAVGERVELWSRGDRVMGVVGGGAYAERAAVHERQLMAVPAPVGLPDAGALPEVFITAYDALVIQGGLGPGGWALVHAGGSGVGTAAIQICGLLGARVAVTCSAGKVQACRD